MGGQDQGVVAARGGAGPTPGPWVDALPPDVVDAFGRNHTCELSTVAKDGTPITWPTTEARDYLRARGLKRPRIDWAEIDAAKKEGAALFEQARRISE